MSRAAPARILLPWTRSCLVCGQDNPIGLRARSWSVGERVELPFTTRPEHAGWSDVVHGGFVATVLDEVMTWAAILGSAKPVYAADFTVRLQAPLRAGLACTACARLTQHRRRIFDIESWLTDDDGTVYARATGRYMPVPGDQMASFHASRGTFVQVANPGVLAPVAQAASDDGGTGGSGDSADGQPALEPPRNTALD